MTTRDEILAMAREAGFSGPNPHDGYMGPAYDRRDFAGAGSLEAFFRLAQAAAYERALAARWSPSVRQTPC